MNARVTPWPIALVTGALGSGKTTMIARLLGAPDMADTLVLVNEFGAVGLDHTLLKAVTDAVVLLPNGCLCCTIRDDIVQTLRDVRRSWLAGRMPDFGRVLIETSGVAEPAPLVATLTTHPILADAFELQAISTVVDGQYGLAQTERSTTCRQQVAVADHLMLSKGDLVAAAATARLRDRLANLNPLATLGTSAEATPADLFRREAARPPRSAMACDAAADHVAGLSTVLLRPEQAMTWSAFQAWLVTVLDAHGSRLLRLKGRLSFSDLPKPVILQAVHHSFYPVLEAPPGGPEEAFLVLIFEGRAPAGLDGWPAAIATEVH